METRRPSTRADTHLLLATLALGAFLGAVHVPPTVLAAGTLVVNSSADTNARDNVLTLREAILVANGSLATGLTPAERTQLSGCTFAGTTIIAGCGAGDGDHITFTVARVDLGRSLPVLTDASTWIDGGTTFPRIDGRAMPSGDALTINGNDMKISDVAVVDVAPGLPLTPFADIRLLGGLGIRIDDDNLGTLPGGPNCAAGGVTRNAAYGVYVAEGATGAAISGNTIGCHSYDGISVWGADYLTISANLIGVNYPENAALPNGREGVLLIASGAGGTHGSVVGNNVLDNNHGNGVSIMGAGPNGGESASDNLVAGNDIDRNDGSGVFLGGNASANWIGATSDRDVRGQNTILLNGSGIRIADSSRNIVKGNRIGSTESGTTAGNLGTGVWVSGASIVNAILGNVIAGNSGPGVMLDGASDTAVSGNHIGTNDNGTVAVPNGQSGVILRAGARRNTIGGTTPAERNVISGNHGYGVLIRDAGTEENQVDFNVIGTNAAGSASLPNTASGVAVVNTTGSNGIGSTLNNHVQVISGNAGNGVFVLNARLTRVMQSNWIGLAADGTRAVPNSLRGIMISGARNTSVMAHIAYNHGTGVAVVGAAVENLVVPREVHHNAALAVDLANDGPTANDPSDADSGPNTLLNFPVLGAGSGPQINGTACPNCRVHIYRAIGNPLAAGGGGIYLLSVVADGGGRWGALLPGTVTRAEITLIAQDVTGNTSEMSPRG